jgi:hypothetical protein
MKYMIMMFSGVGAAIADRSPEWIAGFHQRMMQLDTELRESGELVESRKLADPAQATTVRLADGVPVPTDGPFAEIKESLAGYWVLDVDEQRAREIAARVVAHTGYPMEVRPVMDDRPQP